MKKFLLYAFCTVFLLSACAQVDRANTVEQNQQINGELALLQNQPLPDIGGWSFERQVVIDTYVARNTIVSTYTYMITLDGTTIEICASKGYPIPYSTQLTNPSKVDCTQCANRSVIGNPEPNSLYSPSAADGTLVQCVNPDGTISPTYFEPLVFSLPYRIKADKSLIRDESVKASFSVNVNH